MKKTLFTALIILGIFFYSENAFAALFMLGNNSLVPGEQGLNDSGSQGGGQTQNNYGNSNQSPNSGSGGTTSFGDGGGGDGSGSGSPNIQLAQLENPDEENPDGDDDGGNNGGTNPPNNGLPVTIGGIFPDDYDPAAGGNTTGTNPPNNGLPVTIGGIFPDDYDPVTGNTGNGDTNNGSNVGNPSVPAAHAPEPSTIALLASGLAGIGMRIRRRKK